MTGKQAFISHASKDDTFVNSLRQALELHGASVWADSRELLPGDLLQPVIQQAITDAENFFLLVSPNTFQSKWVKKELDFAKSLQKRIVALLLDEQTVGALAWMFDEEPLAIQVSTAGGGLQKAMPEILAALGLRLPDDVEPAFQPPEPPVNELILVLESPALYTEGGVRRGSGRARLVFQPADGSPAVKSEEFSFISPLGPDVADRIRWYIEEFPRYPFLEKILSRAEEISGKLPEWGEALFKAITTDESARALLLEWKGEKAHERRFSIELDAAAPKNLPDERKAEFYEAVGMLLATPWEILHDGRGFLFQGQQPVRVRRMQPNRKKKDPMPLQNVLRILLVVPRPEDEMAGLIDHRAATRALLEAVDALGDLAELHILESPTFPALTKKIRDANALGKPFSVVHFDGHGVFDKNKGLGALCFESAEKAEQEKIEGRATAIVDAKELAAELDQLRIPLFFLDACQSAKTDHDPTASVAATLLENGVASVAAMSHSVLVTAAEKFAIAFYKRLAEGSLIGSAMLAGQQTLHEDPVRADLPDGEKLRLQDWFVPVLFQEQKDPQLVRSVPGARVRKILDEQWKVKMGATPPAPAHGFIGRDRELLAFERLLLRERYTVLIGQGGAGKTTLATELARWLLRTRRFARLAFISFEFLSDARAAIDALGKQLEVPDFSVATFENEEKAMLALDRRLQEYPTLIVLDNLESILPSPGGEPLLGVAPVEEFTKLFSRLLDGAPSTRLLLTSRERLPAPFDVGKCNVRLGRLSEYDALHLIAEVMKQEGIPVPSLNVEDLDKQFGALARTANYHARALTLLAKTLAERGDALPDLNADLSHLMAELDKKHPGDRENSLFASLELSLRRLPPEMREVVDALAVFHSGADLVSWASVAEQKPEIIAQISMKLVQVGLVELVYNKPPYYFKIDPALPAYLSSHTEPEMLKARRQRWLESTLALFDFLYGEKEKDTQLTYDLCRLAESNLQTMLVQLIELTRPEHIIQIAKRLEEVFFPLGRLQMVLFAQKIREKAATGINKWSHAQFAHKQAEVERFHQQGNLTAALQLAQKLWEQCEQAGANAYPEAAWDIAIANLELGRVLKAVGQSERALNHFEKSQTIFLSQVDAESTTSLRMAAVSVAEAAACFLYLGQYDKSVEYYESSTEIFKKLNSSRSIAVNIGQMGTVRLLQKKYSEALHLYFEAKDIFEKLNEPIEVAGILYQIGAVYRRMGYFKDSEESLQKSLAIRIREKIRKGEVDSLTELGNLYSQTGRLENAVVMYERAANIGAEMGNLYLESVSRSNLVLALLELNRTAEARIQLTRVFECKSQLGYAAEPWSTWALLAYLETAESNQTAAAEARQKAIQIYITYRKDGGSSRNDQFHLVTATMQALQVGQTGDLVAQFENALQQNYPPFVKTLLHALIALLRGSRDPALADDPELSYIDAAELRLAFFGG